MRLSTICLLFGSLVVSSFASIRADDAKGKKGTAKPTPVIRKPDFLPHSKVLAGYTKVISTTDARSFYTIWKRVKDGQMYAELPRGFASQKHFFAMTVASGEMYAGLQVGDMYVYWKRFDKQLALIEPNVSTRSTGEAESRASVRRLFTDRVVTAVPIACIGPGGGPVIDMDALLVGQASTFFGRSARVSNSRLITIKKAKAFKDNVELAFEVPTFGGRLKTLHYSISRIPSSTGYKPRKADERIGYFTTTHTDLGKYKDDETRVRYINRWHLQKRDSKLTLSPPKEPIRFYIEHTTPVRYRRWVKAGILYWNKAFERIGLADAIIVEYQDASGAHMEKDPEDVRYNFVRWLNNDIGTAIGPSRVHPLTGQILDADIILTDGWIRHYFNQFDEVLPKIAMEGFDAQTHAWLATHPRWDPRVRLAPPAQRPHIMAQIARRAAQPYGGHPMAQVDPKTIGDDEFDGLIGRTSQINGLCLAAEGMAFDVAMMRMYLALLDDEDDEKDKKEDEKEKKDEDKDKKDEDKDKKEDEKDKKDDDKDKKDKKDEDKDKKDEDKVKEDKLDEMPESFIGPLIAELVAHEVGHTLGLRHNFKASSIYSLDDMNSEKVKGKKTHAGSVMDYLPINMHLKDGKFQGDHTMIGIGPYDIWAIEYGYTLKSDLKPILDRVAEPELSYATDEDTTGPDPLARRYDFTKNPLDYANSQMELAKYHRERILEKFVKKGDSWSKARRGYELTLHAQTRAVSMMAGWLGGAFVNRDKKGDKNGRAPIEVVPVGQQRDAVQFVIDNTFNDSAYGLSHDLLVRMSVDKWFDRGFFSAFRDATWPIHDRIMGIQASTLTMLLRPTTLERIYDNEFRVPADQDALTLPELLTKVTGAIWSEFDKAPDKQYTARVPLVSSLRRNLQREHMERLIDLSMSGSKFSESYKPISNLATMELRKIRDKIEKTLKEGGDKVDPYTTAHLTEAKERITKALDAQYIYNTDALGGGGGFPFFFFQNQQKPQRK